MLERLGIGLVKGATLKRLRESEIIHKKISFLESIAMPDSIDVIKLIKNSKSQLNQDLFVLCMLEFKTNGFFVEFGATDGISLSNSYLLEKTFGWKGILAEPARVWHDRLSSNRTASIEQCAVWKASGDELSLIEENAAEYSSTREPRRRIGSRKKQKQYNVKTISLNELLEKHKAPRDIDYLSIDTEGSEYEILSNFDFDKHNISIITCEHNFSNDRTLIYNLLSSKGYERVFNEHSRFDDWYVSKSDLQCMQQLTRVKFEN
jgi:FkbM family methyltransferase